MPPKPACTHPHTLVDYSDALHWELTLGRGANYHLPLAVNGFLDPASVQDPGCGQPVAESNWNDWAGVAKCQL